MTEPAEQPAPAKPGRSLTGFYVAVCVLLVLGLLGAWLWTAWNKWWFDAAEARRRQTQAARQLGPPGEKVVDLGGGVELELVLIPAGRFRMGDQAGRDERFGRQWVRITKPFYIGKHEVTQEVWQKVMGTNPSYFRGAKNPVDTVSWDDCQEFLKKLNGLGKGPGWFRLPTEAEWEWACRAGTKTQFCFGDEESGLSDYGWYAGNSGDRTHPVAAKKPNAWGLYDCHGNMWEWCEDWYDEYTHGWRPKADPTGPVIGALRMHRSGSWAEAAMHCWSASRGATSPGNRNEAYGFRVIASSSRAP